SDLVPTITEIMGGYYAELNEKLDFVQTIIKNEEERFHETIGDGELQLENILAQLTEEGKTVVSGAQAFQLYDTFGFPLELTEEMALENKFTVDNDGFEVEMEKQRERARAARSTEESMSVQSEALQGVTTEFEFVGHSQLSSNATIKAIIKDEESLDHLPIDEEAWVFFNRSPFYAEMGGQVADS